MGQSLFFPQQAAGATPAADSGKDSSRPKSKSSRAPAEPAPLPEKPVVPAKPPDPPKKCQSPPSPQQPLTTLTPFQCLEQSSALSLLQPTPLPEKTCGSSGLPPPIPPLVPPPLPQTKRDWRRPWGGGSGAVGEQPKPPVLSRVSPVPGERAQGPARAERALAPPPPAPPRAEVTPQSGDSDKCTSKSSVPAFKMPLSFSLPEKTQNPAQSRFQFRKNQDFDAFLASLQSQSTARRAVGVADSSLKTSPAREDRAPKMASPTQPLSQISPSPTKSASQTSPSPTKSPSQTSALPTKLLSEISPSPTKLPSQIPALPTKLPNQLPGLPTKLPSQIPALPTKLPSQIPALPAKLPSQTSALPTKSPSQTSTLPMPKAKAPATAAVPDKQSPSKSSVRQAPAPPGEQSSLTLLISSAGGAQTFGLSVAQDAAGRAVSSAERERQVQRLRRRQSEMAGARRGKGPPGGEARPDPHPAGPESSPDLRIQGSSPAFSVPPPRPTPAPPPPPVFTFSSGPRKPDAKPAGGTAKFCFSFGPAGAPGTPKLGQAPRNSSQPAVPEGRSTSTSTPTADPSSSPPAEAPAPQKSRIAPIKPLKAKRNLHKGAPPVTPDQPKQEDEEEQREQGSPRSATPPPKLPNTPATPDPPTKPKKKLRFKIPFDLHKGETIAKPAVTASKPEKKEKKDKKDKKGKNKEALPALPAAPPSPERPQRASGGWPAFSSEQGCSCRARCRHQGSSGLPHNVTRWLNTKPNYLCEPPWVTTATLAASVALTLKQDGAYGQ